MSIDSSYLIEIVEHRQTDFHAVHSLSISEEPVVYYALRIVFCCAVVASVLLGPLRANAQITTPTVQTPVAGAGHDYINLLSETVNPADGSLSLTLKLPTPNGRGISLPFALTYNSSVIQVSSYQPGYTWWIPNPKSGWSNSLPYLSWWNTGVNNIESEHPPLTDTCYFSTSYEFYDESSSAHSLDMADVSPGDVNDSCSSPNGGAYSFFPVFNGGDSQVKSTFTEDCGNGFFSSGNGGIECQFANSPVKVLDGAGTIYSFPANFSTGNADAVPPTAQIGEYPTSIEDRNGNVINFSVAGSGALSATDTAGRAVLSFNSPTGTGPTTITAGALTYTIAYKPTASYSYSVPGETLPPPTGVTGTDTVCSFTGTAAWTATGSSSNISTLTLPNGQQYTFQYDPTYGLLNEIDYPDGGKVTYTWGFPSDYSTNALFAGSQNNGTGPTLSNACNFLYSTPVITSRQVSFGGSSSPSLTQMFYYGTSWGTGTSNNYWTSKTTTVVSADAVTGLSAQTIYMYSPFYPNLIPGFNSVGEIAGQIPLEQEVQYFDWGNTSILRTDVKSWFDQFNLQSLQTTIGTGTSEVTYLYGFGGVVTQKNEYDFGSAPPSPPLRQTVTTLQSFPVNPLFPLMNDPNPGSTSTLLAFPCKTVVEDGNGTPYAETDFLYDGGTSVCNAPGTPSVSSVPGGVPNGTHDDTNYSTNSSISRGNITTAIQRCFPNCTDGDLTSTYTYDATGQITSLKDPAQNTTLYSYTDSPSNGNPAGNSNAYVTQIMYPQTNSVNHIESFSYSYSDGQLTQSVDENQQPTNYVYNDPLRRLTETDYADGGSTALCYNDGNSNTPCYNDAYPPTVTQTVLAIPDPSIVTTTVRDGMHHVTQTQLQLATDPQATDLTDTTYDGFGRVYTVSNPHQTATFLSDGTTMYGYDGLGRQKLITRPDGSTAQTNYSAFPTVTVTDEALRKRETVTDGLGRLTDVYEPNPTTGLFDSGDFHTNYIYDPLNNLKSVTQASVNRSFFYDSLSRLTSAYNPETGTTAYTYDSDTNCTQQQTFPGELISKTDARSIRTCMQYDALHRLTGKSYTDPTTPSAIYTYDVSQESGAANTVGRLTYEQVQTGSTVLAKQSLVKYDQVGRLLTDLQCTPANCSGTPYSLQYSYDKAGKLTSAADNLASTPFTAGYVFDAQSHLTQVTSTWNGDSQHPGILYSAQPWGPVGVTDAALGANISLHRDYDNRTRLYHEADQGTVLVPATSGSGSATIQFSEQTKGTDATGSVSIGGPGEQSTQVQTSAGTSGQASATISGSERSAQVSCGHHQTCTVYDTGYVTISIYAYGCTWGGSYHYGQNDTPTTIAVGLRTLVNGGPDTCVNGAQPPLRAFSASASGGTVYVAATAVGSSTNYPISVSSATNSSSFTGTSFPIYASGSTLTGGTDPQYTTVYDSGSVAVKINGYSESVNFGQNSTASGIASSLASAFTNDSSSPATAMASGTTISFTTRQLGANTNYSMSTNVTYDSTDFTQSSFTASPSGSTLTGGTSVSDTGTVTMTVDSSPSFSKTVSYGASDTASTVASNLASAFSNDPNSPVTVMANSSALTITAKQAGASTNYGVTFSTSYDTTDFSSPSFGGPASTTLAGGNDASSGPGTIYSYNLTFAQNNNLSAIMDTVLGTWSYTNPDGSLGYDYLNRLIAGSSSAGPCSGMSLSWTYDQYGNRTSQSAGGTTSCLIAQPIATFSQNNNRIDGFQYDAAGNLLNDNVHQYTYDAENRLSSVDGSESYVYDAGGRRVAKVQTNGGAVISSYVLGLEGEQVTEINASGQWVHSNVYSDGRLLATYDANGTHFHLSDALGTRRVQANVSGVTEGSYFNYPFGDGLVVQGGDATEHHFTGKERDTESGNDYFSARYYASSMGRFMSPDPLPWIHWQHGDDQKKFDSYIANPQDFDMYAYVNNNPLSKTDPTGMNACGTSNDSTCKVTVTIEDRSKDANGHYNDQYTSVKNSANYNATATVTVNGKETGTFLVKTTPSDSSKSATIANGTYSGTLTTHGGDVAIRLQPTNAIPTIGPNPSRQDGASIAQGILVHKAGIGNFTGVGRDGRAVSEGCQVVCSSQYGDFKRATGMIPSAGPPQQHFTIIVGTQENEPQ